MHVRWGGLYVLIALILSFALGRRIFFSSETAGGVHFESASYCEEACQRGRECALQLFGAQAQQHPALQSFESGCLAGCLRRPQLMQNCEAASGPDCRALALCLMAGAR